MKKAINTTCEMKMRKVNRSIRAEKMKEKEAKARRKVNEDWQRIEATSKYCKAANRSVGMNATVKIASEVLDVILLNLYERNCDKSPSEQKRLLRRIVEKRQAQAIHNKTRNNRDRKSAIAVITNSSKCMARLHYLRYA
ncbi:MAG: hypothetical protein NC336_02445 [Clostridium sp.]|nr:hypothetical protein [Clostridium sp.]